MTKILIKKLSKEAVIPKYETNGSSGMDISASIEKEIKIYPGEKAIIPSGFSLSIPKGFEVQIRPRSGLAAKSNISVLNTPGTVDSDYRGELKIILFNHGNKEFIVKNKDRIAQIILVPVLKVDFEEVDNLPDSIRGSGGFGSTGK